MGDYDHRHWIQIMPADKWWVVADGGWWDDRKIDICKWRPVCWAVNRAGDVELLDCDAEGLVCVAADITSLIGIYHERTLPDDTFLRKIAIQNRDRRDKTKEKTNGRGNKTTV